VGDCQAAEAADALARRVAAVGHHRGPRHLRWPNWPRPTGPSRTTPTGRTLGNNLIAALGNFLIADTPAGPCPACGRDGRTSGGTGGLAIGMHLTAPAAALTERAGRPGVPARRWPGRPRSRSKYIGSLPDRASADPGIQYINVPDPYRTVAPAGSVTGVRHVH